MIGREMDCGTTVLTVSDGQAGADPNSSLGHCLQAPMLVLRSGTAKTVVIYPQIKVDPIGDEGDPQIGSLGVTSDVADGFLSNTE